MDKAIDIVASRARKGQFLRAPCSTRGSCWVRITRREKWSSTRTRLHFEDCGNGLPTAQFGTKHLAMTLASFNSALPITVCSAVVMTLVDALKSGKPFTSARWRKLAGAAGYVLRYAVEMRQLWYLDYNDPEGQRAALTRYVRSERTFSPADLLINDYKVIAESPLMRAAWDHRGVK